MNCELAFWKWFVAYEDELLDLEANRDRVFDALYERLKEVHPDLVFEFGPKAKRREFVISAGGLKSAFPAVSSLVAAAPKLDRWKITGFRPRRTPLNQVKIGAESIDPADVEFSFITDDATIGLRLFIPGFRDGNKAMKHIAYLMLDEALGEYDVETKIGLIQMLPSNSLQNGERYPLAELQARFDELTSSVAHTGAPN